MAFEGKTLGLALSGGGFRATLFGLGSLWRLNDAGLLGALDRITSVSGGSIVAGVLAHKWSTLTFEAGRATNFVSAIAEPMQAFCTRTIDIGAGLRGALTPFKSAGDYLRGEYAKHLFGDVKLTDLPDASRPGNPKFIFYATNLQTGVSFRFRQDMLADYILGKSSATDVPLAFAVAASSAFPPVFSPIQLKVDPASWRSGRELPNRKALTEKILLTDGGVYDNMGLESLVDNEDIVLVSDAGAPMEIEEDPDENYVGQLGRVRDILIEQTRALRKRWLVSDFIAGRKRGAYWGIGTEIESYKDAASPFRDTTLTNSLVSVPTRLARFEPQLQGCLVNWGYVLADVALRTRAQLPIPTATTLPLPQWPLNQP